mmetsp:Transcript_14167/g.42668  ORF Transcript_14167/g.42668 Transcript_14167/m.42668 type:complete len:890 (+) Transcript_14167:3441-6110(+)
MWANDAAGEDPAHHQTEQAIAFGVLLLEAARLQFTSHPDHHVQQCLEGVHARLIGAVLGARAQHVQQHVEQGWQEAYHLGDVGVVHLVQHRHQTLVVEELLKVVGGEQIGKARVLRIERALQMHAQLQNRLAAVHQLELLGARVARLQARQIARLQLLGRPHHHAVGLVLCVIRGHDAVVAEERQHTKAGHLGHRLLLLALGALADDVRNREEQVIARRQRLGQRDHPLVVEGRRLTVVDHLRAQQRRVAARVALAQQAGRPRLHDTDVATAKLHLHAEIVVLARPTAKVQQQRRHPQEVHRRNERLEHGRLRKLGDLAHHLHLGLPAACGQRRRRRHSIRFAVLLHGGPRRRLRLLLRLLPIARPLLALFAAAAAPLRLLLRLLFLVFLLVAVVAVCRRASILRRRGGRPIGTLRAFARRGGVCVSAARSSRRRFAGLTLREVRLIDLLEKGPEALWEHTLGDADAVEEKVAVTSERLAFGCLAGVVDLLGDQLEEIVLGVVRIDRGEAGGVAHVEVAVGGKHRHRTPGERLAVGAEAVAKVGHLGLDLLALLEHVFLAADLGVGRDAVIEIHALQHLLHLEHQPHVGVALLRQCEQAAAHLGTRIGVRAASVAQHHENGLVVEVKIEVLRDLLARAHIVEAQRTVERLQRSQIECERARLQPQLQHALLRVQQNVRVLERVSLQLDALGWFPEVLGIVVAEDREAVLCTRVAVVLVGRGAVVRLHQAKMVVIEFQHRFLALQHQLLAFGCLLFTLFFGLLSCSQQKWVRSRYSRRDASRLRRFFWFGGFYTHTAGTTTELLLHRELINGRCRRRAGSLFSGDTQPFHGALGSARRNRFDFGHGRSDRIHLEGGWIQVPDCRHFGSIILCIVAFHTNPRSSVGLEDAL